MAGLSDYAENLIAEWLFTTNSATRPTAWWLALYTAAPSDSGGGTEVSGGGYARQSLAFSATADTDVNTATITFTASGGNFGVVTHAGIFDASSGGNLLMWCALASPQTINDGQSLAVSPGNLTTRFD